MLTPAIIIARPGLLRDSLKIVMEASNKVTFIGAGDDWTTGLKMIDELDPQLVVMDTDSVDHNFSWRTLAQLQNQKSHAPYCVVVHTREEENQARNAGAKIVLQAGFSTQTFFDAIAKLTSIAPNDPIETNNHERLIDASIASIQNPQDDNSKNGSDKQGGGASIIDVLASA